MIALPYLARSKTYERFDSGDVNTVVHDALSRSAIRPCYLEIVGDNTQHFLFFRARQIYSAGRIERGQLAETLIRDWIVAGSQPNSPTVTCYDINNKILHSILIAFQKKPTLKLLTSLVDLDEVLDRIENEGKSCVVCAMQDSFLALLRYEKGTVTALCHEQSLTVPLERTFREDFLVKIYTLSAQKPLEITIYEDLLVKYASDAKLIGEDDTEDITTIYLAKPPTVTLEFKNKEIGHWVLDRPVFNIGRTEDNDIVIDNLAVSRLHAVLEKDKGEYYIRDCDSLNGTLVNGKRVGRARLENGDEIVIGKHKLVVHAGSRKSLLTSQDELEKTMIMTPEERPLVAAAHEKEIYRAKLVEKTGSGDIVVELNKPNFVLGKDEEADIALNGFLVARRHAEILRRDGEYVIRHVAGIRKVTVGGRAVRETVLRNNDSIRIANREFIFQE